MVKDVRCESAIKYSTRTFFYDTSSTYTKKKLRRPL